MYIYKTTNLVNGKIYVGLSKFDPEDNPQYIGSGHILKKAINRYGKDNFTKKIIEICHNRKQLEERERYWIAELKSNHDGIGYNICEGGQWGDNWTHNPRKAELRKMFSEMYQGKDNPNYGHKWTQKQKDYNSRIALKKKVWIDKKTGLPWSQIPKIRKKLSMTKMGLKNPNASFWKLISPEGKEFTIEGGIKKNIKQYGLDYQQFKVGNGPGTRIDDKTIQNCSGWRLIKLPRPI